MDIQLLFSEITPSLSLGVLTLCLILNLLMGLIILQADWKSATHRIFAFLTLSISLWLAAFFFSLQPMSSSALSLFLIRLSIALAAPINALFFFLAATFPGRVVEMHRRTQLSVILLLVVIMGVAISPYTFTNVVLTSGIPEPVPGPGLVAFTLFVIGTNIATFVHLVRRYRASTGDLRRQLEHLIIGIALFLVAMFLSVLMPSVVFQSFTAIPFAPLYALVFISFATYASLRHHLFNVKIIATESFVTLLLIVYLVRVFVGDTLADQLISSIIFFATLFFGVLLIRSVKEEVRQREEIKRLAKELATTNYELARSNEQLKILDQRKSEFVSLVSHQLRAPITAIKGYTSLLLEGFYGKLTKKEFEPVERVYNSSQRLVKMVADFLDISKIEQGKMAYTFTDIDLGEMVRDVAAEFVFVAKEKGLSFDTDIAKKTKFPVSADEGKLRQVVSNIIDNSIKYTPNGGITVSVERDTAKKTVQVRIKDTGIGLSEPDKEHIFGKFSRGEGGQKENTHGSGLGLYVAKIMVEAQNGKLWVESEGVGKGSTFVIELAAKMP